MASDVRRAGLDKGDPVMMTRIVLVLLLVGFSLGVFLSNFQDRWKICDGLDFLLQVEGSFP